MEWANMGRKGLNMDGSAQPTPLAVTIVFAAVAGFVIAGAAGVWLARGPAILIELSHLSAAFVCP